MRNRSFLTTRVTPALPVRIIWLLLILISAAAAQIANLNNLTSVPIPGAGHDELFGLSEVVNPANGSLSVRIGVSVPKSRGVSLPFFFAYDSNGVYSPNLIVFNQQYYDAVAAVNWVLNHAYLQSNGWSFSLPTLDWVLLYQKMSGETTTAVTSTDYMFLDPSGGRHPLYLGSGPN